MSVELLRVDGSDLDVVNAARVSFDKQSEWEGSVVWSGEDQKVETRLSERDAKLVSYLARHNHWTPFGHVGAQFRVKAPIFVARQLVKHQIGLVWNEVSRRYVDSEPEFWTPKVWRGRAENVKQGSSDIPVVPKGKDGDCPYCGVRFVSRGNKQRYCSVNCQTKHYRTMPWGWAKTKIARARVSAERRGIEFSITADDIEMPVRCPYLGIELQYGNEEIGDNSASLDRVDSSRGYVTGNIQTVSFLANKMKSHATNDQLVAFARATLARHAGVLAVPEPGVLGAYKAAVDVYSTLLEEGVCPEQARMFLPLGSMTEWIWTGSIAAWARVCNLRLDPHAQAETREVAEHFDRLLRPAFPVSWAALSQRCD